MLLPSNMRTNSSTRFLILCLRWMAVYCQPVAAPACQSQVVDLKFKKAYDVSPIGDCIPVDALRNPELGVGLLDPGMTSSVEVLARR